MTVDDLIYHPGMRRIEDGLNEYLIELSAAMADDEEDFPTESGNLYCGCDTCAVREILAYVVPRVMELTLQIAGGEET